ncbi:TetR/AcrR family transcriptional regulator [Dactylosporangium sp. McL0621]|uniref:TetR/AcrR family transcriptional regulator n=1 Tax=Dactylosporangium sp. McL0621 TaxID=3415678 RepID=UPI003CFA07FE
MTQPPARDRLMAVATALFYAEGIHAVGIDRIIAGAGVAKATFYHHFASKDELVRGYLVEEYQRQRNALEAVHRAAAGPREALLGIFELLVDNAAHPRFRGCPFTNAAAEYPDPDHPVRRTIADYRSWNRGLFRDLLAASAHPDPDGTATILMAIRDGIVVGGALDDPAALPLQVRATVTRLTDPGRAGAVPIV